MPGCARSKVGNSVPNRQRPRARSWRNAIGNSSARLITCLTGSFFDCTVVDEVGGEGVDVGQQAVGAEQVADAGIAVVVADDLDAALGLGVVGALGQERELDRQVEVAARQRARLAASSYHSPALNSRMSRNSRFSSA